LVLPALMFATGAEEDHSSDPMAFWGKVINFVILFGGLGLLLAKPLRRYLGKRGEGISRTIRDTRESRDKAEARLQETHKRLEDLTGEIARIQKEAESQGQQGKTNILERAQEDSERLKKLAQEEMGLISKSLTRELREYTADLAIEKAQERLQKSLTPERQARLIDHSIESLERLYEKSGSG
jgi:F-type H+-transporting ATPase subunit b